jgi:methyl-galactoside transport system substrate-binding protein
MKRSALVLASIALVLASCSSSGKDRPKLGLAMNSFDDAMSVAIRRSIETQALDKADLAIINGQNQQSTQDMQVDSFFERKLGSIAVDPVDASAVSPVIVKAKASRTPIVFFDRRPSDEAMRSWDRLFFVGTRGSDAGAALGEILASYWKENPGADKNKDDAASYVALASEGSEVDMALVTESCAKALGSAGIVARRLSDGEAESGRKSAEERAAALIGKFGERIEAVVCADEASALAATEAFKAAGYFKGKKYIPIVVVSEGELPPPLSQALAEGSLLGAALGDPSGVGKAVFDLSYALAKGIKPSKAGWPITDAKYIWIPYRKVSGSPTRTQGK